MNFKSCSKVFQVLIRFVKYTSHPFVFINADFAVFSLGLNNNYSWIF